MTDFLSRFLLRGEREGQEFGATGDMLRSLIGAGTYSVSSPVSAPSGSPVVHDFAAAVRRPIEPELSLQNHSPDTGAGRSESPLWIALNRTPTEILTARLEDDGCPRTACIIYRALHDIGLECARQQGLPVPPTVMTFHLPVDLLAAYLQMDRTTVWRNLPHLSGRGILDVRDHYSTLNGHAAVSGKVWAVSLTPARVLDGKASPVRLTYADLNHPWRDLELDVRIGRTAYALTRSEAQQQADKARWNAVPAEERKASWQRAGERASARAEGRKRGEHVLTGRAAATASAAETRALKASSARAKKGVQQSIRNPKTVNRDQLIQWALRPSSQDPDVTLTVASSPCDLRSVIHSLPVLAGLTKKARGSAVETAARKLAAAFEDTSNLRFWCWLLWAMIHSASQGQDYFGNVSHVLLRVLHDIGDDESRHHRTQRKPAALVIRELNFSGLMDALREFRRYRAGVDPGSSTAW